MAATDPKRGMFNPLRGDAVQMGPTPTLYHSESQHDSMLEPWYLTLNPAGNVPTLVRTVDDKEHAVVETLDILRYVDANLKGPRLIPTDPEGAERMERLVSRISTLPMDDFTHGHLLRTNGGFRHIMPRVLEGSLPMLRAMADDEKVEVGVRTSADAKIEETEALLKKFEDPEALYQPARDKVLEVLSELDALLIEHYSNATPFLCGESYSLADGAPPASFARTLFSFLATCLLARALWTDEGQECIRTRPKLQAYFERMRRRPSFDKAQVWTGLRPGRIFCVVGDMMSGAFRSVGSFLNETVVHPVQQTPAYAWYVEEAAPFFVDHFNLTSGVVVEDVTLPTVRVIDDNVVQPTVQATQAAVNSTAQFVSDSAAATSGAIAGTADAAVHNDAVHSVEEGLHTMGDEAARQAAMLRDATDKALITPTKEALMENVVPQMANHGRKIAEYTDHVEHFVNDKIVTPLRDSEALRSTGDAVKRTYAGAHYHFHHSFLPTVMDSVFLRLV